ncbi:rab proteins geranylgeranyltransferase component A-like [Centruroides sculpturatus]|uniref:rab proteins geranylgeranyltransferase component A-like n=1 Tax=Centruroides sculpturatus TaxID=218467 RepID=UPI000C6E66BF|nr:rab proteins geranylgeranyltransferase component A-like [Centruroides sculpturatus]
MEDDLPTNYDIVVIGTGMPECIIAAAAARIGKTVLHLDRNDYYGGDWASFNFDQLQSWIQNYEETNIEQTSNEERQEYLSEGEMYIHLKRQVSNVSNVFELSFIRDNEDEITQEQENTSNVHCEENIRNEEILTSSNNIVANETVSESETEAVVNDDVQHSEISENQEHDDHVESSIVNSEETGNEPKNSEERHNEENTHALKCKIKNWTLTALKNQYRKFNLDLSPKILFSRGSLVELLISSNIARYAEFKSVSRILTLMDGVLKPVPCSRADVFSTKNVTVVEKRMLMKFLTFCLEYHKHPEEYRGYEGRPFVDFLKSQKLTPQVEHYILYAIAMVDESTPTLQGLKAVQTFLESLGRYGNSPFLWSLYGSAELPQCFCRLCAVFGGIYHLKRTAESLILHSDGSFKGLISNGQRINCSWMVMESSYITSNQDQFNNLTNSLLSSDINPKRISRGIFITDSSILSVEREQITLLRIPTKCSVNSTITVLELGPGAMVCPDQTYVVHFTCQSVAETAKEDLYPAMELLFTIDSNESKDSEENCKNYRKPKVLWCVFFNQVDTTTVNLDVVNYQGLLLTSTPGSHLDYEYAVKEAKEIFQKMFPDEEFLPRAPDPEEILLEPCNNNPGEDEIEAANNSEKKETSLINENSSVSENKLGNDQGETDNGNEGNETAEK